MMRGAPAAINKGVFSTDAAKLISSSNSRTYSVDCRCLVARGREKRLTGDTDLYTVD